VLVVDEPGPTLSRLSAALQDDGYVVVVATSEHDVVDALGAQSVSCVVTPLESAAPAMRQRATAAGVPVLMTVPAGDDALVARALDAGADDGAPLSADLSVLRSRLRAVIRRTRIEAEQHAAMTRALAQKDAELISLNYAISHDLRAPLRAIDGFSRILVEECAGTLDPKHASYLERISAAAGELGVFIEDLLQLSRVGRAELRKGRVDLSDLARRLIGDLQNRSDRQVDVDVQAELAVYADRRLMRVALEHLIGNSWKFTAQAQPARIEVRSAPQGGETVIVVRDNGVGFDQARAGKLFQPFQRLHTKAEFEGAGIGLAVVHKIVDRHGGRVWAEGRTGQGASFFFTLPPGPDGDSR
jgi:light-regulated signal transduction histidine kinase (bacteriophytochrome)